MSTLVITFKSGTQVVLDKVENWTVGSGGATVTKISITQSKTAKNRLIIQSIDMSSIDCIVEKK